MSAWAVVESAACLRVPSEGSRYSCSRRPLAFTATACGGDNGPKTANVKAGTMPEGGEWQGVYYSQHYGHLHLLADGDSVSGAWKTPMGLFGELHGKTEGNLLRYEWKERRIGAVGKDAVKEGKGYFVYSEPKAGEAHEITR